MDRKLSWVLGLCMALTAGTAMGMSQQPTSQPTTAPAIEDAVMPPGPFNGVSLVDLLGFLQQEMPGFNSVVIRDPDAPPDYPTFDNLSLKNVTLGQFMDLVRFSFPGVYVQRIYGRIEPLYVLHISAPPVDNPTPGRRAAGGNGGWGGGEGAGNSNDARPVVKVYSLQEVVSAVANGGDSKKAMENVLSLLQAALDQQGGKDPPVLKVHEPTMMLIVKGSQVQLGVLEQTLNAMEPSVNTEAARLKSQFVAEMAKASLSRERDQETIDDLTKRLDVMSAQIPLLQNQIAVLKSQLEAANSATKPKG